MEVPEIMLNVDLVFVLFSTETGHAARMLTPGPIISGFKIPKLCLFGPLEEKEVTSGADGFPITVPLNKNVAVGVRADQLLY